jgi:hypothetical protein
MVVRHDVCDIGQSHQQIEADWNQLLDNKITPHVRRREDSVVTRQVKPRRWLDEQPKRLKADIKPASIKVDEKSLTINTKSPLLPNLITSSRPS